MGDASSTKCEGDNSHETAGPMLGASARVGSVGRGDAAMTDDASAGEKPPAPTPADSPPNHHTHDQDAVLVHQTHRVTRDGITTTTTLTTPSGTHQIPEAVADQLQLKFDLTPTNLGIATSEPWSYADHALTRLEGGEDA